MKRIFRYLSFAALAAAVLVSCMKTEQPAAIEDGYGTLNLTVEGLRTRADISSRTESLAYETAVNSLYVGVFGDDGMLSWNSTSVSVGTPSSATVRTGSNITIVAVANYPVASLTACASLSQLNALTATLEQNSTSAATGFVMVGRATGVSLSAGGSVSCSVSMSRLACRIALAHLNVDLDDDSFDYYQGKPFILKCVYLANVCGKARLDGIGCDDTWYNIGGRSLLGSIIEADAIEAFLDSELAVPDLTYSSDCYYDGGTECNPDGEDYGGHPSQNEFDFFEGVLYDGYGNPIAGELEGMVSILYCYAPPATPSYTCKFVLELSFQSPSGNWVNYFYPVNLTGLAAGRAYSVDLTITKLGTLDPDTTDWVYYGSVTPGSDDDNPGGDIIIEW